MPYRRLPNTDTSRIKALNRALQKGKELPPFKLAFSQNSLSKLQSFIRSFDHALCMQKQNFKHQTEKSQGFKEAQKKARLYISHYIQVMNLAIIRGDLPCRIRAVYGLDENLKSLPSLRTDKEIIELGEKLINGEGVRIRDGISSITNPTLALVKVQYEQYLDAYMYQKTLRKKYKRTLQELAALRDRADDVILTIWNEVEDYFKDLPEDIRREKAAEYGLNYVYRKNELQKIRFLKEEQRDIG